MLAGRPYSIITRGRSDNIQFDQLANLQIRDHPSLPAPVFKQSPQLWSLKREPKVGMKAGKTRIIAPTVAEAEMEVQYLLKIGILARDRILYSARPEKTTSTDSSGKSDLRASPSRISTRSATPSSGALLTGAMLPAVRIY